MGMLYESLLQSQIFFFISSVGFIILGLLAVVLLLYFIRAMSTFNRIMDNMEKNIDKIGDTTKEMFGEMKDSFIFNFLFKKKKRRKD
ncbi:MAG: hypothetical protein NUV53_00320 [Patescibacteria group bacterium]|nr:hypothetical protein [Patescibacteria group bacterium]